LNRLYKSYTDKQPLSGGLIDYVKSVVSNKDATVYVGTDSAVKGKYVHYAVVVALRYKQKGAHVVYRRIKLPRKVIRNNYDRLFKETEFSVELANYLRESGVYIEAVELDYNQDETRFSSRLINVCEGWCKGLEYKTITKPDAMIAARAADKICNT